jgi:hypothetical protein
MISGLAMLAPMTTDVGIVMSERRLREERIGGVLLVAGGIVAVPLWLVFTSVHGPTSFNENNITLGLDMHAWGLMLGVIPNALVAAGLWLSRPMLLRGGGRAARIGFGLLLLALLVSAGLDLLFRALGPPLLLPFVAAGLLLLALAPREAPGVDSAIRTTLLALGLLLTIAFGWGLVPLETSDSVGGYRIYGFLAHLLAGLGWALLGLVIIRRHPDVPSAD